MNLKSLPVRWNPATMTHEAYCPSCKELAFMITHEFLVEYRDRIKVPFLAPHDCQFGEKPESAG